jgi:nucleoside-diphosphate-sugar epimerase
MSGSSRYVVSRPAGRPPFWTAEMLLGAARDWHGRYGCLPRASDWSLSRARSLGGNAIARLDSPPSFAPRWPSASTVSGLFGDWGPFTLLACRPLARSDPARHPDVDQDEATVDWLVDLGSHAFDMLRRWLGPDAEVTSFRDNAQAAMASEIAVELTVGQVPVEVRLSWLRTLDNRCVIEGESRTLSIGLDLNADFEERDRDGRVLDRGAIGGADTLGALFRRQLDGFARAVHGMPNELATVDDGIATIELMESCHALRGGYLPRPWQGPGRGGGASDERQVAVTGATGFIGANIVDRLAEAGDRSRVVAVSRSFAGLVRLLHLDGARLRCARADVRDRDALIDAFSGCDAVIHAAYGSSGSAQERWSVTVGGTAAALSAAAAAGVRHFVHISSMAVYDLRGITRLDESCAMLDRDDLDRSYPQQKLAAEILAAQAAGTAMEIVSLQPSFVYGPWGPNWTLRPLERLRRGDDDLPSGSGGGICNPVHVHDVADAAMFLAAAAPADAGRLLVTGPDHVTWGRYYDAYRDLVGAARETSFDPSGAPALEIVVDAGRLRECGFEPRIGIEQGLAHVGTWARWAGFAATAIGGDLRPRTGDAA